MPLSSLNKWDLRFLDLCKTISLWSKDPSTKVGAAIVRPNRSICSLGYNGFAQRVNDDESKYLDRDTKYEHIVHGEMNAILFAREDLTGYTLYTYPFMPCSRCTGMVIQTGISTIVCPISSRQDTKVNFDYARQQFKEANVILKELHYGH